MYCQFRQICTPQIHRTTAQLQNKLTKPNTLHRIQFSKATNNVYISSTVIEQWSKRSISKNMPFIN